MSVGYDLDEDDRSFEQSGLTGTVTRYTESSMVYPCYIVKAPFETYKLKVLQSMFHKVSFDSEEDGDLAIQLYFESGEQIVGLGKIFPRQVKSFLRLFEGSDIKGYYDENTMLEGDYLYVLGG